VKTPSRNSKRNPRVSGGHRQAILLCALALPFLVGMYAIVVGYWAKPVSSGHELRVDEFLSLAAKGRVGSATILSADNRLVGTYDGGAKYWLDFSGGHETLFARLTGALEQAGVPTRVQAQPLKGLIGPATTLLPVLILGDLIMILFLAGRSGGALGSFGRASAHQVGEGSPTTFADLAGADEAVEELREIRDFLADPARFTGMGASVPKGVLLSGPPGCGKTRLAKAVAGESDVPFFPISGSDFVEMYVGVGAARIRDLFAQAKAAAPAIVFIDEIDAVGRARSVSGAGGSDEREATLNQLLVEMDGFGADSGVVVMAATNRPDILDSALLRPGRFDRRITLEPPDLAGRAAILAIHAAHKPLGDAVDLPAVAQQTAGFSGADLANVVNEAALLATRRRSSCVDAVDFSEAIERVVAGPSRRSRVLTAADKTRIACHEAGHALVAAALSGTGSVAKVSIIARGRAGGSTVSVPDGDRVLATRTELTHRLAVLLGGRVAERIVLGETSTGSNDDVRQAADLARRMVWECAMSDRLGPLAMSPALPNEGEAPPWSEQVLAEVDAETQALLTAAEATAAATLTANGSTLEAMAAALAASETLEGDALDRFLAQVRAVAGAGLAVVA
jgi:cell division protease FtsH